MSWPAIAPQSRLDGVLVGLNAQKSITLYQFKTVCFWQGLADWGRAGLGGGRRRSTERQTLASCGQFIEGHVNRPMLLCMEHIRRPAMVDHVIRPQAICARVKVSGTWYKA